MSSPAFPILADQHVHSRKLILFFSLCWKTPPNYLPPFTPRNILMNVVRHMAPLLISDFGSPEHLGPFKNLPVTMTGSVMVLVWAWNLFFQISLELWGCGHGFILPFLHWTQCDLHGLPFFIVTKSAWKMVTEQVPWLRADWYPYLVQHSYQLQHPHTLVSSPFVFTWFFSSVSENWA